MILGSNIARSVNNIKSISCVLRFILFWWGKENLRPTQQMNFLIISSLNVKNAVEQKEHFLQILSESRLFKICCLSLYKLRNHKIPINCKDGSIFGCWMLAQCYFNFPSFEVFSPPLTTSIICCKVRPKVRLMASESLKTGLSRLL